VSKGKAWAWAAAAGLAAIALLGRGELMRYANSLLGGAGGGGDEGGEGESMMPPEPARPQLVLDPGLYGITPGTPPTAPLPEPEQPAAQPGAGTGTSPGDSHASGGGGEAPAPAPAPPPRSPGRHLPGVSTAGVAEALAEGAAFVGGAELARRAGGAVARRWHSWRSSVKAKRVKRVRASAEEARVRRAFREVKGEVRARAVAKREGISVRRLLRRVESRFKPGKAARIVHAAESRVSRVLRRVAARMPRGAETAVVLTGRAVPSFSRLLRKIGLKAPELRFGRGFV